MALIGSIAIDMRANVQKFTQAMATAGKSVKAFGAGASRSVATFGGLMGEAARATADVVNQFYVRPLVRAGKVVGDFGQEIGASARFAARIFAPPLRVAGDLVAGFTQASIRAGLALGRMGLSTAAKGMGLLWSATKGLAGGLREAINQVGLFGGKALIGAGYAVFKLASAATALGEQTDRSRVVFGRFADAVIAESEAMAGAFGVSRAAFIQSAAAFGSIFKGVGYSSEQASQLSIHFVKLATDLSSFAHIPVAEALEKIQSGLAGQVRPLREVGVFMSEEAIKAKAVAMGFARANAELTESQKVQARVAFITDQLKDAQGNLALTSGSVANQTRAVIGRLENLAQTVGTALLPVIGTALGDLQVGVEALSLAWQDWTAGAVSSQVGVVGAVGETAASMGWLQKSVGFVVDAWQTLKLGFYAAQSYITAGLSGIISGLGLLASSIDHVVEKLTGFRTGIGDFLKTYGEDLSRLSGEQWKKFQSELAKPPASEGVAKYFQDAQDRIKAMRTEATKAGVDVGKITPANAPAAKADLPKFASAMAAGSGEATNAILRARFGGTTPGADAQKQTAQNTKKTVDLLSQAVGRLGEIAQGGANRAVGSAFAALPGLF